MLLSFAAALVSGPNTVSVAWFSIRVIVCPALPPVDSLEEVALCSAAVLVCGCAGMLVGVVSPMVVGLLRPAGWLFLLTSWHISLASCRFLGSSVISVLLLVVRAGRCSVADSLLVLAVICLILWAVSLA